MPSSYELSWLHMPTNGAIRLGGIDPIRAVQGDTQEQVRIHATRNVARRAGRHVVLICHLIERGDMPPLMKKQFLHSQMVRNTSSIPVVRCVAIRCAKRSGTIIRSSSNTTSPRVQARMLCGFTTKIREHACRKSGSYSNDESLHYSRNVYAQGMDLPSSGYSIKISYVM